MYKIRHKTTGKFLSGWGSRLARYINFNNYPITAYITPVGRHWVMKYAVDKLMKNLEIKFPGQFEIVEFVAKEK